jgi:hypothetical protein
MGWLTSALHQLTLKVYQLTLMRFRRSEGLCT